MKWFSNGVELFRKEPLLMILIGITFVIISISTKLIPGVGFLFSGYLSSVLLVGMMKGCRDLDAGTPLTFEHLFSGFSEDLKGLLVLYLCQMAMIAMCVVAFVSALVAVLGFTIVGIILSSKSLAYFLDSLEPQAVILILFLGFLCVLAVILVATSFVYAPYLLCFKKEKVLDALKKSLTGVMTHMWPLTALGLLHLATLLLCFLTLGLGFVVAAPILFCSFYFSYKDIFAPAFSDAGPAEQQNGDPISPA